MESNEKSILTDTSISLESHSIESNEINENFNDHNDITPSESYFEKMNKLKESSNKKKEDNFLILQKQRTIECFKNDTKKNKFYTLLKL